MCKYEMDPTSIVEDTEIIGVAGPYITIASHKRSLCMGNPPGESTDDQCIPLEKGGGNAKTISR